MPRRSMRDIEKNASFPLVKEGDFSRRFFVSKKTRPGVFDGRIWSIEVSGISPDASNKWMKASGFAQIPGSLCIEKILRKEALNIGMRRLRCSV